MLETLGGNIPSIFAYPAGLGDVAVALVALGVLLVYKNRDAIPRATIALVLVLGVTDFLNAFFFGFTLSAGPQQLFSRFRRTIRCSPTGLIPLVLVPYAILFHTLLYLMLQRSRTGILVQRAASG